jgi:twinfilin-like protein
LCFDHELTSSALIYFISEELILVTHKDVKYDWKQDFNRNVSSETIEADVPCYLIYRLDDKTAEGYAWMLISWMPDTGEARDNCLCLCLYQQVCVILFFYCVATTRQKMIYASTKLTLKQQFGSSQLKEEYHATTLDEMSFEGYMRNKASMSAPTPLTRGEEEMRELKRSENKAEIGIDARHQTMSGISCPITEAAKQAIKDMLKGAYNYLQFHIDLEKEEIHISKADNIQVSKLAQQLPENHARFHIYLFKHSYESDFLESYVFIYSMPGYTCSVKERMMYSSCKAPFLDSIHLLGVEFAKKLEVDDPSELSEENLIDELHPKKLLHKTQFAKPPPPGKRGPKRLIK